MEFVDGEFGECSQEVAGLGSVTSEASAGGLEEGAGVICRLLPSRVSRGRWWWAEKRAGAVSWGSCVWPLGFRII